MGRKSTPILLKATSPEGETKMFTSISEAAKELGFSEHGVGKAFHEKRNRIGGYELEWLERERDCDPKAAARIEGLKRVLTLTVCTYCNKPLTCEDRVQPMSKLTESHSEMEFYFIHFGPVRSCGGSHLGPVIKDTAGFHSK